MASQIREAKASDVDEIVRVTNEAFLADAYFKKEEFHLRTNVGFVEGVIEKNDEHEKFLVCDDPNEGGKLLGSVLVSVHKSIGHFGMVSVTNSARNRGVGGSLIFAAEAFCQGHGATVLEMPVIHSREDLIPWYKKKGYEQFDDVPFEAPEIVLDGVQVRMLMFRKKLE